MSRRVVHLLFLAALLSAVGGCANKAHREAERAVSEYFAGDYERSTRRLTPLAAKTDENFVLNNLRLGSAALAHYDLDAAEGAFLRAYEVLNSVGVNDGGRTLGAVLVSENIRIWRGEPFERAMANFYLGLVYYMQRDYANARGAFENALFKLRDYGEKKGAKSDQYDEVESNFALGHLMLAKAHQRLGRDDMAEKFFKRAAELRPDLAPAADPETNRRANVLLVVDFGHGPRKVGDGMGSVVGFAPKPTEVGPPPPPWVTVDGSHLQVGAVARPPVDLLVLAQDRRWQSIDTIRVMKDVIGTGLMFGGMVYGTQHNARPEIVLATLLGGALLKASSQADLRQWEMLPRTTYVLPLTLPPGTHEVTVDFPAVAGVRQTWRGIVAPPEGEEATYYLRMLRWNYGPYQWPPPAMARRDDAAPASADAATPRGQPAVEDDPDSKR